MPIRWLLVPAMTLCCLSHAAEKPPCNARNKGEVWPPPGARSAGRPLEMCTLNVWKYRWELVTVPVSQLAKNPKHKAKPDAAQPDGTPDRRLTSH